MPNPLENDPVARMIARTVQHHLITSPAERPGLPPLPEQVTALEAHAVGLDTGVVVTTADRGTRYFLVRVQEYAHR